MLEHSFDEGACLYFPIVLNTYIILIPHALTLLDRPLIRYVSPI